MLCGTRTAARAQDVRPHIRAATMRQAMLGTLGCSVRAHLRSAHRPCVLALASRKDMSSSASSSGASEEPAAKRLKAELDNSSSSSNASSNSMSNSSSSSSGNGNGSGESRSFLSNLFSTSAWSGSSTSSMGSDDGDIANNSADEAADVSSDDGINGAKVVAAFKAGKLGFGFSAGGLLFPYYVGVISALREANVLTGAPAQMAGASAGSLIAASYNAGLPMEVVEESMIRFGEDLRTHGTRGRLGPLLKDFLHEYMPEDAHERCNGTTHVSMTRVVPIWRATMVSNFHSRQDLIDALLTSCHIPWYFDGRWVSKYRGHFCFDGGATNFMPRPPDVDVAVKVCCFHTKSLLAVRERARRFPFVTEALDIAISPDKFENWPYDVQQVVKWALQASSEEVSSNLIEKGKRDARKWMQLTGLDVAAAAMAAEGKQVKDKVAEKQSAGAASAAA